MSADAINFTGRIGSLTPGTTAPRLRVQIADGSLWTLEEQRPRTFTLIAFYRGGFCSYCRDFIGSLDRLANDFRDRGIDTIAISGDSKKEAVAVSADWQLSTLRIGYGLGLSTAREWGLYVTERETAGVRLRFTEPAVVLVKPSNEIYAVLSSSIPCGRPDLPSLLKGLDFLAEQGYPTRGTA